jgi:hypothetical protein
VRSLSEACQLAAQRPDTLERLRGYQAAHVARMCRDDLPEAAIASEYQAGASVLTLRRRYRCSEPTILSILDRQGTPRRGPREWGPAQLTDRPRSLSARQAGARTAQERLSQNVGLGEEEVANRLRASGQQVTRQCAVGPYTSTSPWVGWPSEVTHRRRPHLAGSLHRRVTICKSWLGRALSLGHAIASRSS